jgi:hypothetical protein
MIAVDDFCYCDRPALARIQIKYKDAETRYNKLLKFMWL